MQEVTVNLNIDAVQIYKKKLKLKKEKTYVGEKGKIKRVLI